MTDNAFDPLELAPGFTLRNRLAMAPMTTWSGNPDGTVSQAELDWYLPRVNGVGLVITGCTHVQANGIGFTDEFAAFDDRFIPSLTELARVTRSGGAVSVLQIFHAGNKAVPALAGDVVSASAVATEASPFAPGITPRALSEAEIEALIADFGAATRRAIAAGFDGVELHGAHGFLLQNFLSPRANRRADGWGGSLENRMRLPLAVLAEVRRVAATAGRPFVVGYRVSPEEPGEGGLRIGDVLALTDALIAGGVDYLHVSLVDLLTARPLDRPAEALTAELFARQVAGRVPLIAAGQVRTPDQARQALALGLSLVAIGKGLVMNPDWVEDARADRADRIVTELDLKRADKLAIPAKLQTVISATAGWFPLRQAA